MKKILLSITLLLPFIVQASFEYDYAKQQIAIIKNAANGEQGYYKRPELLHALEFVVKHREHLEEIGLLKDLQKELNKAAITEKLLQDPVIKEQLKNEISAKIHISGTITALSLTTCAIVSYLLTKKISLNAQLACVLLQAITIESALFGTVFLMANLHGYCTLDETQQHKLDNVQSILSAFTGINKIK